MTEQPKFEPDKEFAQQMANELGIPLAEALEALKAMQEDIGEKRGGKVSRKRGKKIMQGYKAGGKV
jgi:hypothetical protein